MYRMYQQKPLFSVQRFCNSGLDIGAFKSVKHSD